MDNKYTSIDDELFKALIRIKDEKRFVNGVFSYAKKQDERKKITEFIKKKNFKVTTSDIMMIALEFHNNRH